MVTLRRRKWVEVSNKQSGEKERRGQVNTYPRRKRKNSYTPLGIASRKAFYFFE